jgi:hypothetical protein
LISYLEENSYAFRIVPGMEKRMLKEKTEIQRLVEDAELRFEVPSRRRK